MNNTTILEGINSALAFIAQNKLCHTAYDQGVRRALINSLMYLEISDDLETLKDYIMDEHLEKQFDVYLKPKRSEYSDGQAKAYGCVLNMVNVQIDLEGGVV